MDESKLKRSTKDENQYCTEEPPSKKRKENNNLLQMFNCIYFYIDKSLLIKEFLEDAPKIVCVTSPSGFGKSTNLRMLRFFFEMNYEKIEENEFQNLQNKKYFENLLISKEKKDDQTYLDKYQGKYPVIYLNFDSFFLIRSTFEATIEEFKGFIEDLYLRYRNINFENLDNYEREQWKKFQNGNVSIDELKESISFLCLSLNKALRKEIVLLIDNYDSPMLSIINTNNEFYKFYEQVFMDIFIQDKRYHYLFKTFITGKLKVNKDIYKSIDFKNYSIINSKYNKYFSVTDSELKKIVSIFNLKSEYFDNYCYDNINKLSSTYSTKVNNTNEVNIIFSSNLIDNIRNTNRSNKSNDIKADNINDNDKVNNYNGNNNKDDKIKIYDLYSVVNFIKEIIKRNNIYYFSIWKFEKFFNEIFINFDYILIKDIAFLLKNGYIEKKIPKLINYEMLKKDYIEKHREIIWTLFIEYGYLIDVSTNDCSISEVRKLKINTKIFREIIETKFSKWKRDLCNDKKIENALDLLTSDYDEERIIEFLKDTIMNNLGYSYSNDEYKFLDKYYTIIYSLLSLNYNYEVVTKKNFNENDNIRELLVIHKKYLESNTLNDIETTIVYIIIKNLNEDIGEKGCIEALDYNENLVFDDIELKKKYDKIIKFGIAIYEEKCDVIYEINYRNNFKKKKKQVNKVYTGELYGIAKKSNFYLVDKTKMISKLIGKEGYAFMIIRPRRYGKSLNLNMIRQFFEKPIDIEEKQERNSLFDGLEVSKDRKNMRHYHKYPVIYLNLNIYFMDYSSAIESLRYTISHLFNDYKNRIDFNKLRKDQQEQWNKIVERSDDVLLEQTIKFLCECLKEFYKRKCIILIDEYDKLFFGRIESDYDRRMFDTINSFFSETFKENEYLYFGIVTGCLDAELNDLNSGVNNIFNKCSPLKDIYFSDCYGFTEDELEKLLSHFNISDTKENGIKKRLKIEYDGYSCFSDKGIIKNIYNAYTIMNFIVHNMNQSDDFKLSSYWVNTGNDNELKKIITNSNLNFDVKFLSLFCNKIIKLSFDKDYQFDHNYLIKDTPYKDVWRLLLFSGYLTVADEKEYKENIKNMNDEMIKITSTDPTLMEMDSNEIQEYKSNLLKKKESKDIFYFKIPNQEIFYNLNSLIKKINGETENAYIINNFINGIYQKDLKAINESLNKYLLEFSSHHLFVWKERNSKASTQIKKSTELTEYSPPENVYQVFLMQLFTILKNVLVKKESRYDINNLAFSSKFYSSNLYIIEVKVSSKDEKNSLSKACKEAINQIEERKYESKFKYYEGFIKYGMAFHKRKCMVEMKINNGVIQEYSNENKKSKKNKKNKKNEKNEKNKKN